MIAPRFSHKAFEIALRVRRVAKQVPADRAVALTYPPHLFHCLQEFVSGFRIDSIFHNSDGRTFRNLRLPASFPWGSLAKGIVLADFDILLDYIPKTYNVTAKCLVALIIRKQPSRCGVNALFVNRSYRAQESTGSGRLLFEHVRRPENKRGPEQ